MLTGIHHAAPRGATSLERTLDQATDRYRDAVRQRLDQKPAGAPLEGSAALALASERRSPLSLPLTRLTWRGIEVSDEFQRYAARVAGGEELAPFRGEVLALACGEFPLGPEGPREPRARLRKRSLVTGWIHGAGALLVSTCLVGAGAAAMANNAPNPLLPVRSSSALKAAPPGSMPGPSSMSLEQHELELSNEATLGGESSSATPAVASHRLGLPASAAPRERRAPRPRAATSLGPATLASSAATGAHALAGSLARGVANTASEGAGANVERDARGAGEVSALLLVTPPF